MVNTVITFGSGDQPSVRFDFSADSRAIPSNAFGDLCDLQSLLQTCLDSKPIIICKVFIAHVYLQSEGRTKDSLLEKRQKETMKLQLQLHGSYSL